MKVLSSFIFLAIAALVLQSSADSAEKSNLFWLNDYGTALKAAKDTGKPLLVVLDKPKTTGEKLDLNSLTKEKTQQELLSSYLLCHVDVTSSMGEATAKAFKTTSFPHTAIIDKTGSIILFKTTGKIELKEWVKVLSHYESGDRNIRNASYSSKTMFSGSFFPENCFT